MYGRDPISFLSHENEFLTSFSANGNTILYGSALKLLCRKMLHDMSIFCESSNNYRCNSFHSGNAIDKL